MTSKDQMELLINNEKEWRQYLIQKVDRIDEELNSFKMRVMFFALVFGSGSGIGANVILEYFK